MPSGAILLQLWLLVASAYGISWIVQPIAYFATLGTAGSYIGWLAGSVGDIRLPAASMAQKVAGVEPGTHEGDVIGTIGTACSVFVSAGMITLFIIIGSWVVPKLPPFVTEAFNHILPALFGAFFCAQVGGQRNVLQHGILRKQVERLKHKAKVQPFAADGIGRWLFRLRGIEQHFPVDGN